MEIASKAGS